MRATLTELLLLCQLQTGFRIRDNLDLASTERAFKTAFRKILNHIDIRIGGKKASIKQAWNMVPAINSIRCVTGHTRPGVCRRPIVSDVFWHIIVERCKEAMNMGNCRESFGVGYRVKLPNLKDISWTPSSITLTYQMIQDHIKQKVNSAVDRTKEVQQDAVVDEQLPEPLPTSPLLSMRCRGGA